MKKIIALTAFAVLMAGLFFGCADEADQEVVTTTTTTSPTTTTTPSDITTTTTTSPTTTTTPSDITFIEVPDPLSGDNPTYPLVTREAPVVGVSFVDPHFGTTLTRATTTDGCNSRHEYSRFDPFNKDKTMIVLVRDDGAWSIYKTQSMPYNQSSNLVSIISLEDPRWDPDDSNLLWGLEDFSIVTVNVQTDEKTTIKNFSTDLTIAPIIAANPDLYRITMRNEGESSLDNRYWALFLQGSLDDYRVRYLFTWDRQQNQILGTYTIPMPEANLVDWCGMSPLGNWVLIGCDAAGASGYKFDGLTMANKELIQFYKLADSTGHADVGLDSQGKEVIVMQNSQTDYIDLIPIDTTAEPVQLMLLFYSSTSPIGLNSGVHISCNTSGYCVVSTETPQGSAEQNWLDRTITLVKLDRSNPRVFYLAKVYGTTGEYWEETQGTITNDGAKVVWATNWNQNVGQEQVFLMQLDMPAKTTWP
jgi:hypothetical protein